MLKKMHDTEIEYVKNFSRSSEDNEIIRFWDDNLPDMYTHNFILIKNKFEIDHIKNIILNELEGRKKEGFNFLRVEFNFPIDNDNFEDFKIMPEITKYDYMYIDPEMGAGLTGNQECIIRKAVSETVLKDGIEVDILANEANTGKDFAEKRIYRKSKSYQKSSINLDLYVCYNNGIPVGNCELLLYKNIAKIEDFDILENYQRRGFGTAVIKHLLKEAAEQKIDIVYLITDSDDTAKEMYKKCGFKKAGEKTELFFDISAE